MSSKIKIHLIIILVLILSFTVTASAATDKGNKPTSVTGIFLNKNIVINGSTYHNHNLQNPFVIIDGITYVGLDNTNKNILGITSKLEGDKLSISKVGPKIVYDNKLRCNLVNQTLTPTNITIENQTKDNKVYKSSCGVYYISLRALNYDLGFNEYVGVYISTKANVPVNSIMDQHEISKNKGVVNYMMSKNKSLTKNKALELLFLFKHEAEVNGLDPEILIAVAEKESNFNTNCENNGTIGIMQILDKTAEGYGVNPKYLYDAHTNIQFAAMYLSKKINTHGDITTALSAYNRGSVPVEKGEVYRTAYSDRINQAEQNLDNYLIKYVHG